MPHGVPAVAKRRMKAMDKKQQMLEEADKTLSAILLVLELTYLVLTAVRVFKNRKV